MLHSIFLKKECIALIKTISTTGLLITITNTLWLKNIYQEKITFCNELLQLDKYSYFSQILFSFLLLILFLLPEKKSIDRETKTERHIILLSTLLCCNILSMSCHWLSTYLIITFMSILIAAIIYNGEKEKSMSHAIQYLIYSAVSSAITLFGISCYYAVFHTLSWSPDISILEKINPEIFSVLIIICISNLLFNLTVFPYHFVVEQKYKGAKSKNLAYISFIPQIATLLCFNKFLSTILHNTNYNFYISLKNFLIVLSIITIILGSIKAIKAKNNYTKLAYASMANMGVILGYITVFPRLGNNVFYYITAYSIANLGIWICINIFEEKNIDINTTSNKNTEKKYNYLYSCFIVFLVSLVGLPPSAGFSAKLFILIDLGRLCITYNDKLYYLLFISTIITVPISLYYYLEIARSIFKNKNIIDVEITTITKIIIASLAILVVVGFYAPGFLYLIS